MKKFRTVVSVIIMVLAGILGFFAGAALGDSFGGAIRNKISNIFDRLQMPRRMLHPTGYCIIVSRMRK